MNSLTAVCVLAMVSVAAAGSLYTDRYDNVNVKEIISNRKVLVPYIKCLIDTGRCAPEGKELKSHIKEALENYCGKCTQAQRDGTKIVIGHIINEEPEYWDQLTAKYDSEKKYVTKYENELRTVKV